MNAQMSPPVSRRAAASGLSRRAFLSGVGIAVAAPLVCAARLHAQTAGPALGSSTPTATGRASINGAELYYEVHGPADGSPLLLHAGFLGNTGHWSRQIPALVAGGHRVVAFDARAEGRSTWGDLPPTIAQAGKDAVGLLDYLEIERTHVLGWSRGGNVAIELAIRHGERLNRAIAYGGAYSPECCYAEPHFSNEMPPFEQITADYQRLSPAPERLEELFAFDAAHPQNFSEVELGSITVPFLVLDGAEEEFTKPEHIVELAKHIPGAELVLMPGTGHFAPVAHPDMFNRIVLAFLAGEKVGTPMA